MFDHITYLLVALLTAIVILYKYLFKSPYKFPPGPKGWPLIGNLLDITLSLAHHQYTQLSKQYGDMFTLNLMGQKVVVLNSTDVMREAFVSEETRDIFAGRPDNFYVRYCDLGPSTSFSTYNEVWKLQRQHMMKTLKVFDSGKHKIENTIQEQLEIAIQMIRDTDGKSFNLKTILGPSLANIIAILIAGKRHEFEDPALKVCMELDEVDSRIGAGHAVTILTLFPFLRHLPFWIGKRFKEQQECLYRFLHYYFDIPKKTFDPEAPRGLVDSLFVLQKTNPWLTDDSIKGILRETDVAGLATTRGSLMPFFLIILHHPEVMRKIQNEIDEVIGERLPIISDKHNMPYTEAATLELLRYVTVAPLTLPHTTMTDVKFRGYFIPKNTVVFANQWAAHHDENVWGDPWDYRPDRFLDDHGNLKDLESTERKSFMAFGLGRRMCLGETFARTRMFLVITTLLQQFDFLPCVDEPLPSHDVRTFQLGITLQDPYYKLRATRRKDCSTSES